MHMMAPMSYQGRADKTRDKTRRGGLPAATEHTLLVNDGDGRPCDGCSETIHPSERASLVSVHQALCWRFHDVCYEAWSTFTRDGR
jgi:hypothetical protein